MVVLEEKMDALDPNKKRLKVSWMTIRQESWPKTSHGKSKEKNMKETGSSNKAEL